MMHYNFYKCMNMLQSVSIEIHSSFFDSKPLTETLNTITSSLDLFYYL
jgi:hypothetical protein